MIASDTDLREALECGILKLTPMPPDDAIQPASIELRLDLSGGALRPIRGASVTIGADVKAVPKMAPDGCAYGLLVLKPGDCALVTTRERVTLARNIAAQVAGKSSLARLFLIVHTTAGWIDPGFDGQVTLELVNHSPQTLVLEDGMKIAQLVVFKLGTPAARPYGHKELGSHYQGQVGATASRYGEEV